MSKFHSRQGLHFERRNDGSVAITVEVSGTDRNGRAFSWPTEYVLLDADTWASAVASVTRQGENGYSFGRALALHNDEGMPEPLPAPIPPVEESPE